MHSQLTGPGHVPCVVEQKGKLTCERQLLVIMEHIGCSKLIKMLSIISYGNLCILDTHVKVLLSVKGELVEERF